MNDVSFDTLARDSHAPQGRRFALKALGLAALGAVAGAPLAADAKNNNGGNNGGNIGGKKNRKKNRKQGRNDQQECPPEDCTAEAQQAVAAVCQGQVTQCEQEFREFCRERETPEQEAACFTAFSPCCASLTTCDAAGFLTCFIQKLL